MNLEPLSTFGKKNYKSSIFRWGWHWSNVGHIWPLKIKEGLTFDQKIFEIVSVFLQLFIFLSNFVSPFSNSCFFSLKQRLPQHLSHEAVSLPPSLLSTSWPTANLTADRYSKSDSWQRPQIWQLTETANHLTHNWLSADTQLSASWHTSKAKPKDSWPTADRQLIWQLTVSWSDSWHLTSIAKFSEKQTKHVVYKLVL